MKLISRSPVNTLAAGTPQKTKGKLERRQLPSAQPIHSRRRILRPKSQHPASVSRMRSTREVLRVPSLTFNRRSFNRCPFNLCSRGRSCGSLFRLGWQRKRYVLFTIQSLADTAIDSRQRRRLHLMVWRHVVKGVPGYPICIGKSDHAVLECDQVCGLPRPHDHHTRDRRGGGRRIHHRHG
jgi:hypothetical protein